MPYYAHSHTYRHLIGPLELAANDLPKLPVVQTLNNPNIFLINPNIILYYVIFIKYFMNIQNIVIVNNSTIILMYSSINNIIINRKNYSHILLTLFSSCYQL